MYRANDDRYSNMLYRKAGKSGLKLSALTLGMWHNFGTNSDYKTTEDIVKEAFDNGITSFDLANNYGPENGSAEIRFGEIIRNNFSSYRDEMVIATKAGYNMWSGPYGDGGSKKYLVSSLNQSLKRLGLDYVDIFYHHRPDEETPLEETMEALSSIVNSGKALYVALSNYGEEIFEAKRILEENYHISPILNQVSFSILNRRGDKDGTLFPRLKEEGIGIAAFSPLSQGRLTDKYLNGTIPSSSRAHENGFLKESDITPELVIILNKLNDMAKQRGQSLAEMALNWDLDIDGMTTVIVGARNKEQLQGSLKTISTLSSFSLEDKKKIEELVKDISFRR